MKCYVCGVTFSDIVPIRNDKTGELFNAEQIAIRKHIIPLCPKCMRLLCLVYYATDDSFPFFPDGAE